MHVLTGHAEHGSLRYVVPGEHSSPAEWRMRRRNSSGCSAERWRGPEYLANRLGCAGLPVLSSITADNPDTQARGRNLLLDCHWAGGVVTRLASEVTSLVHSTPDLLFAIATRSLVALAQLMRTIPIVVVQAADPWR
jgi:hypothetical protein